MSIVRDLVTRALREIGAYSATDTPLAEDADAQAALGYLQMQIDAWNAERDTLIVQARVPYIWPAGRTEATIGPGGDINVQRPTWLDHVRYVIPGSWPEVEVSLGSLDDDSYALTTIKELPNTLPLHFYYQSGPVTGTLVLWPKVVREIKLYIYYLSGPERPTTLDDWLEGPSGYEEAFHYQLSERLLTPFGVNDAAIISMVRDHSATSFARMKRPNTQPGQRSLDAAVTGGQGAYNVLADTFSGGR